MTSTLILISVVLLVSSWCFCQKSGSDTIDNYSCRPGHRCGRHGTRYSWCYIDTEGNYDYCCDTPCLYDTKDALRCNSGEFSMYCGNPGNRTALGHTCLSSHPCGHRREEYYWCYIDNKKNWDYCCHPGAPCFKRAGAKHNQCNVGRYKGEGSSLAECASKE